MADAKTIYVYPRRAGTLARAASHVSFWGVLVLATGTAHAWFGGSVVFDIFALILGLAWLHMLRQIMDGERVELSGDEVERWVKAGCPADVKRWRDRNG